MVLLFPDAAKVRLLDANSACRISALRAVVISL